MQKPSSSSINTSNARLHLQHIYNHGDDIDSESIDRQGDNGNDDIDNYEDDDNDNSNNNALLSEDNIVINADHVSNDDNADGSSSNYNNKTAGTQQQLIRDWRSSAKNRSRICDVKTSSSASPSTSHKQD